VDDRVVDNKTAPIGSVRTGPGAINGWKMVVFLQLFKNKNDIVKLIDEQVAKHVKRAWNPEETGWDTMEVLDALMGAENEEAVRNLPPHVRGHTDKELD
jgi:hypothetical protein